MTRSLKREILSRGYWEINIFPQNVKEKRFPRLGDLYSILEKNVVSIRGWNFPHLDTRNLVERHDTWISQEFSRDFHLSVLHFFQSGQFYFLEAFPRDWQDRSKIWPSDENWKPGAFLGVGETLFRFTEIFEFGTRLMLNELWDDVTVFKIKLGNLLDRHLTVDDSRREGFWYPRKSSMTDLIYEVSLGRNDLVSGPKPLAIVASIYVFERFGWDDANEKTLSSWYDKLGI